MPVVHVDVGLARTRLGSAKSPKTLVAVTADQCLEAKSNGIRICLRSRCRLRIPQETIVNVQSLLHTDDCAIDVWLLDG